MQLKPLGDHVVVEPVIDQEVTKSGIILPDTVDKEKSQQGKVVAVGVGKLMDDGSRATMEVKVGDVVVYKSYSSDEFKIEDKKYLIVSASDVIAILE